MIILEALYYTYILDGFEQKVDKSSNSFEDIHFYSGKKSCPTVNVVIFASPSAKKFFHVVRSIGGNVNDPASITEPSRLSKWYPKVTRKDRGLGDAIFTNLRQYNIDPVPDRFLNPELYSQCTSVRVNVENRVADLRDWKILKYPYRSKLGNDREAFLDEHHQICVIIAVLINDFQRS